MRAISLFFTYLSGCLALAAVLTCPLVQTGWFGHDHAGVMGRVTQFVALLGLWPFLRRQGLADRSALGYGAAPGTLLRALGRGWVLGAAMLAVPVLALFAAGVLVPQPVPSLEFVARKSVQAVAGGLLIAILEETFFRGALWSAVRRSGGVAAAALWSSALYALAHFIKPHPWPAGTACDWSGAWRMFAQVFAEGVHAHDLDSLVAIFAGGVLLALVREHTGHIGWCIGLHAGWVWLIQSARRVTEPNPDSPLSDLVGCYDEIIGWAVAAWVGILILVFWYGIGPRRAGLRAFRPATTAGYRPDAGG